MLLICKTRSFKIWCIVPIQLHLPYLHLYITSLTEKPIYLQSSNTSSQVFILVNFCKDSSLCMETSHLGSFLCCAVLCLVAQSCPFFATPWTATHQVPLSVGILKARILESVAMPSTRGSSQPRDRMKFSCIVGRYFTV